MRRRVAAATSGALITSSLLLAPAAAAAAAAAADCSTVGGADEGFIAQTCVSNLPDVDYSSAGQSPSVDAGAQVSISHVPVCAWGGGAGAIRLCNTTECGDKGIVVTTYALHTDGTSESLGEQCLMQSAAALADVAPPQVTPGMVLAAFRRVALPDSQLTIAPPGGKTLVGLDTILSTEAEPFTEVLTLLGQRVELAIEPAQFTWVHGDGTSQTTDEPGVPYTEGRPMSDYVAHRYAAVAEQLALRVDTTWSARFRVNGGPWQDVGDTVTIEGPPVGLEVVEAEPNLVGS
jgi:hypothetical protein